MITFNLGLMNNQSTIAYKYKYDYKLNGPEFSPIDMLSTQTAGKRNKNKICVFVKEKTHTQKYKKKFQKNITGTTSQKATKNAM